jgi:hypothetical protein
MRRKVDEPVVGRNSRIVNCDFLIYGVVELLVGQGVGGKSMLRMVQSSEEVGVAPGGAQRARDYPVLPAYEQGQGHSWGVAVLVVDPNVVPLCQLTEGELVERVLADNVNYHQLAIASVVSPGA